MEIHPEPFSLHRLLDDVVAVIQPRADSKHLALNQRRDEDVPDMVEGDAAKLRQILINLLGNAVKFTEHGSVTLEIRWLGSERVGFSVRDTGVGISPKDLERIFEPFQQAGALPQQWRQEGTGLGLAISRRLVEVMGADLVVESEEGKGSQFSFLLHLPPSDQVVERAQSGSALKLAPGPHFPVLIVDDVQHNRDTLARQLRHMGFEVQTADSGERALQLMEQSPARLVFMDIRMPGMDGITCARELRKRHQELTILAFTASVFDAKVNNEILQHFDALILKPVDLAQVVTAISKCTPLRFVSSERAPAAAPAGAGNGAANVACLSEQELAKLNSWLASGAIARIREYAEELNGGEGVRKTLGNQLYKLARAYDIEGLRRLLQVSDADKP
jgi:CheY-like chemotaxis protein